VIGVCVCVCDMSVCLLSSSLSVAGCNAWLSVALIMIDFEKILFDILYTLYLAAGDQMIINASPFLHIDTSIIHVTGCLLLVLCVFIFDLTFAFAFIMMHLFYV